MKYYLVSVMAATLCLGSFAGQHDCKSACPSACPEIPACPACPSSTSDTPCELSHGKVGREKGSKYLFNAANLGTIGEVGTTSTIGIGFSSWDHVFFALKAGLKYNPNAVSNLQWDFALGASLEYMIVDACPFSMGPTVSALVDLTGGDYNSTDLFAGVNFWYTPFNAPLSVGTSLGANVRLQKGVEPTVSLSTPGLKLLYMFN